MSATIPKTGIYADPPYSREELAGTADATNVDYDPAGTSLSEQATSASAAITELAARASDGVVHDPAGTNLVATDVKAALAELDARVHALENP